MIVRGERRVKGGDASRWFLGEGMRRDDVIVKSGRMNITCIAFVFFVPFCKTSSFFGLAVFGFRAND
jgi:hypothetical protein